MSRKLMLGELLLQHNWLSAEALQRALANQVTYGGRLGTNLIELGLLPLDQVAEALGAQHGVTAAPVAMLEAVTRDTLRLARAEFCAAKGVLPLRFDQSTVAYETSALHLAMLDPGRAGEIEEMMKASAVKVVGYVVPQLRLLYYLERYYSIPRAKRYLRVADGGQRSDDRRNYLAPTVPRTPQRTPPGLDPRFPQPSPAELAAWDGKTGPFQVPAMQAPTSTGWDGRTGPIQPQALPEPEPELDDGLVYLDQIVRERPAKKSDIDIDIDVDIDFDDDDRVSDAEAYTVDAALDKLGAASSRDEVIQCLVRPVFGEVSLNVAFMPRGELAVAAAAWGADVEATRVGALVVPLNIPSLLKRAADSRVVLIGKRDDDSLQEMIAVYLRAEPPTQVGVAPVFVAGRLGVLLCTHTTSALPATAVADMTRLAQAAELAFARLLAQVAPGS